MHGSSLVYSFDDASVPERHTQQYFEILGNRGMYKDGWWLSWMLPTHPVEGRPGDDQGLRAGCLGPGERSGGALLPAGRLRAGEQPRRRSTPRRSEELKELFWQEADKYDVLPLLAGLATFFGMTPPLSTQTQFTYYGDVQNVASGMIPKIFNHSYTISAELDIPAGGAEGVIVAEADHLGGFSLFVRGRQAEAHLLVRRGVRVQAGVGNATAHGERRRAHGVRRGRGEARPPVGK